MASSSCMRACDIAASRSTRRLETVLLQLSTAAPPLGLVGACFDPTRVFRSHQHSRKALSALVTSSSGQERYQRATAAAQPSPNSSSAATRRFAATAAMTATVELPVGLMVLGTSYIALTIVIGLANAVLTAPLMAMIRRKSAYFDDWNEGLKAPWVFWRIGGLWFRITELLGNYVLPAPQRVMDMASSFFRSQVLISLTQLGVPDALRSGPKSGAQLAAEVGAHLPYLLRVLRAAERMGLLAAAKAARTSADSSRGSAGAAAAKGGPDSGKGRVQLVLQDGSGSSAASSDSGGSADNQQAQAEVVAETEEEGADVLYELTQLSAVLCGDHPNSVRAMVLLFGDHYAPFGHLAEGVRGGRTAYELWSGGLGHWEHMAQQPALLERFNRAMVDFNNLCPAAATFREVDFSRFSRLVDVGGGLGGFTAAALAAAPRLRAHVFDMPAVIEQAQQVWRAERAALLPRVAFSSGCFFKAGQLPAAASDSDVFVMRQILHDWPDRDALKLLRQVRAAIGGFSGARLLIIEACVAKGLMTTTHTPRLLGDVHMMVVYGGAKERSDSQFARLLAAAGFRLARVTPTKSLFFVLEAVPV